MPSENIGSNGSMEAALTELKDLRIFQGTAREFWPRFTAGMGQLTLAGKVVVLVRQTGEDGFVWRKVGEWVSHGSSAARSLGAFTSQLETIANRCVESQNVLFPLEPASPRGAGHYVVGIRLILHRSDDPCIATCLLSEVNETTAREGLLRLGLVADVPASYQVNLAGEQARTDVQKFASTLDIMSQMNVEKRFLASALAVCNGLATHFHCDRVSLGWLEGGYIRLRAISRTEKFDRQMAAARALEIAMEECLDQDDEVVVPPPENATVVTRDHEAFVKDQKAGHVCSLPLRLDGKVVAVLTCERQQGAFAELELQQLRLCCDQMTRRLSDLKQHDRWFGQDPDFLSSPATRRLGMQDVHRLHLAATPMRWRAVFHSRTAETIARARCS